MVYRAPEDGPHLRPTVVLSKDHCRLSHQKRRVFNYATHDDKKSRVSHLFIPDTCLTFLNDELKTMINCFRLHFEVIITSYGYISRRSDSETHVLATGTCLLSMGPDPEVILVKKKNKKKKKIMAMKEAIRDF